MKVTEINIYPVKSLRGFSCQNSVVKKRGFKNDRRFMLVDENNDFLTQREFSKMATITTQITGNGLKFSAPGFEDLIISKDFSKGEVATVRVWQSFCRALVAEESINNWFGEVLHKKCKLVKMPGTTNRLINEKFNKGDEIVSFADGFPFLIISENSLNDLNSRLQKQIPMNRFRPNLVISGAEAYEEDSWKKIKIGKTIFRTTKTCARCVIPNIDQKTGISEIKEPLKTLSNYRKSIDIFPYTFEELGLGKNDVLFGQNLVAENFGKEIKIGDRVEVLE
jgi:uncharacterized protein YcbX